MIQNATLKDCEKKLKRSKFEIESNNIKIRELQEEKNKLTQRLQNLKVFCNQYQQSCQKIENNFIQNIKSHQEEQNNLNNQENELINLRNDQIKLVNNEQIAQNQLLKNKLYLKDVQEQKKLFKKKLDDISLKVRLQEEIKQSLNQENLKILQGLQNFQDKNKNLNQDIVQLIDVIQKETQNVNNPQASLLKQA